MSWRPTYRSSKFRNVYGKVANREHCFEGIPITKNVHDNHFCAVNSKFLAIVTESAGGGSFIVIPVTQVTAATDLLRANTPLALAFSLAICLRAMGEWKGWTIGEIKMKKEELQWISTHKELQHEKFCSFVSFILDVKHNSPSNSQVSVTLKQMWRSCMYGYWVKCSMDQYFGTEVVSCGHGCHAPFYSLHFRP